MSVVKYKHSGGSWEYCSCAQCRDRGRSRTLKVRAFKKYDRRNWKAEVMAQIEDSAESTGVYAIINEWDEGSEIVGGWYFLTEDDAWDHLFLVAEDLDIRLPEEDTSFRVDNDENDTYYITELTLYEEN